MTLIYLIIFLKSLYTITTQRNFKLILYYILIIAAEDELTFDPDDVITNIEMVSIYCIILMK